ncbi:TetR/AcrR family transcriptional regulator [Actinomycetospora termitidis]|uniref:TetR/AcrR family transcriptional regulator n=1 Tax=Actinomycetospora termitidis TaxID=3053470 RepID=A0ABT7MGU5_9PSEU|nr:TetR/AcrR family transcriptional regulator [Actinomycetospora sp. Odt1-22]MDL5159910.1 TetR/AcrR family transcriptional regulator [Actinomycetospora sp. Odt1-22]
MSTRDALVEATADLLWERGYSATSPAMILARSGAGQGSMYHHFRGKADLARAAMQHAADEMTTGLETADDPSLPALERVRAFLGSLRDPLRGCRIGRLVQDAEVVDDDDLRGVADQYLHGLEQWVTDVLDAGRAAGELRPDADTAAAAAMVVAVVQGGFVLARARQDAAPQQAAVRGALAALDALAV